MKIFIDSTWKIIYLYENGRQKDQLLNNTGAFSWQSMIDDILTPSQLFHYVTGNDITYTLSKKKEAILNKYINGDWD